MYIQIFLVSVLGTVPTTSLRSLRIRNIGVSSLARLLVCLRSVLLAECLSHFRKGRIHLTLLYLLSASHCRRLWIIRASFIAVSYLRGD